MPNTHETLGSLFTDIADAIRTKKGESSDVKYVADNFPSAIASIDTGGAIRDFYEYSKQTFNPGSVTGQQTQTFSIPTHEDALYYVVTFFLSYSKSPFGGPDFVTAIIDAYGSIIASYRNSTASLTVSSVADGFINFAASYTAPSGSLAGNVHGEAVVGFVTEKHYDIVISSTYTLASETVWSATPYNYIDLSTKLSETGSLDIIAASKSLRNPNTFAFYNVLEINDAGDAFHIILYNTDPEVAEAQRIVQLLVAPDGTVNVA